jgi:cytochrome oxidase assembly protein ShyY1
MARAMGIGPVAPFYIAQESPVPRGGLPKPGPLTANLRNAHLQYAITWFGLAAVLAVVFLSWAGRRQRGGAI